MATTVRFPPLRNSIAGLSVAQLAAEFGTPTYVYDAAKICERIDDLRAFDLRALRRKKPARTWRSWTWCVARACLVDAVSAGEIRRAMAAGYQAAGDPPPIVYTADIFDRESLELVVEHGIHVNCGSPDMIEQLGRVAPGREITLRLNPGFGHGHSQKTNTGGEQSKHGIWHAAARRVPAQGRSHRPGRHRAAHAHRLGHRSGTPGAGLRGAGAGCPRSRSHADFDQRRRRVAGALSRRARAYVDLDAYFKLWDATRKRLEDAFGHAVRLEIEPGRYLVAESGYLVAQIRAIKQMGNNTFYLLDAGFNNLARPILYGAYHPMSIVPSERPSVERPLVPTWWWGARCASRATFSPKRTAASSPPRPLPAAEVGEYLVIECAGAYGFVMGSNYNSKPLAAEVLIDDGQPHLVRRRQTFEDLIAGESIPK